MDKREPTGDLRADYHAALIARSIMESVRAKGPASKLEDFLLKFKGAQQPPKQQTISEMKSRLRLASEMGEKAK